MNLNEQIEERANNPSIAINKTWVTIANLACRTVVAIALVAACVVLVLHGFNGWAVAMISLAVSALVTSN